MDAKMIGINIQTGALLPTFAPTEILQQKFPLLFQASNEDRLTIIKTQDKFEQSIPVYSFKNGRIIESFCEMLGFPNTTHDGQIMYENTHHTNKEDAIEYARKNLASRIENLNDSLTEMENQLTIKKNKMMDAEKLLAELNALYPPKS